ncbi:ATP synthase D chain, mitochondrial (ATP5H) [Seminavis robusta]|uniref:ATP synthase D chain, mitochondrial (ATP5H) n=1 Tax=Seminavis robusta TaxID=568900 RepID=A0A9N8HR36_9STRA|nr:ATP synthase D chain, mitochondrial (ATP5H) [Seminavis robusta]|eukprot:Sro1270_g258020.1 ATP synthase D chain, mitochondrial (ATP5H) (401) ;mRNA; r:29860-31062
MDIPLGGDTLHTAKQRKPSSPAHSPTNGNGITQNTTISMNNNKPKMLRKRTPRKQYGVAGVLFVVGILWNMSAPRPIPHSANVKTTIDFVTSGNMKSGTSTLLYAFNDHPEVEHPDYEMCFVLGPSFLGKWGLNRNFAALQERALTSKKPKMAMKCPLIGFNRNAVQRLHQHSPNAKFLLTLRHPVFTIESLYNYWVIWSYKWNIPGFLIPSFRMFQFLDPALSAGSNSWKGLFFITRFEEHLANYKTTVLRDFNKQQKQNKQQKRQPVIHLMAMDQMKDKNETRNHLFLQSIQDFLELKKPLRSLANPENKNHFVGERAFPEIIDICDDTKFLKVRQRILKHAHHTIEWMQTNFLTEPGVQVANRDHFVEIMKSWTKDPCPERTERRSCISGHCQKKYE